MIEYYLGNVFKDNKIKLLLLFLVVIEGVSIINGSKEFAMDNTEMENIYSCIYGNTINFYSLTFLYMPLFLFFCVLQYNYILDVSTVTRFQSRNRLFAENVKINMICTMVFNLVLFSELFISMLIYDIHMLKDTYFVGNVILQQLSMLLGMFALATLSNIVYYCLTIKAVAFIIPYVVIALDFIFFLKPDINFNIITQKMLYYYPEGNEGKLLNNIWGNAYLVSLLIFLVFVGLQFFHGKDFIQNGRSDENY